MPIGSALSPRRSLVVPAATVAAPLAYAVLRDANTAHGGRPTATHVALFCGAILAGYLVACLLVAAVDTDRVARRHWLLASAVRPSTATLALFGVGVLGGTLYLAAALTVGVPPVVTSLLTPVGGLMGLPLVILYGGMVAAGNAVGTEPALGWQFLVVGLGIALSVIWTFTLSAGLARLGGG
jgi:hypothetical protein